MSREIPIAGPWITEREIRYVSDAATVAWYTDANRYVGRFESAFADYLGVKHAIALPSCTSAIHLSLAALGVGPGDEVIVPDVTWIASAAPVTYVGAETVFADIDPITWCLSPDSFEQCITPRTKAVIPVGLYGGMPDMNAIRAIAGPRGIAIIEDAAEAVGSEYWDRKAGSLGDTGVFSFHGSKTMTTGEGGMLVTDRDDLYERILLLRDHGRPPGDRLFHNTEVAFKYKMSNFQAAMGLAQLERIQELVDRKRQIFFWYRDELVEVPGISLNHEPDGVVNSYWMVTVVVDPGYGLTKMVLMQCMQELGVDTRPFFFPLSDIPAYKNSAQAGLARERNLNSYAVSPYGINLPSALILKQDDVHVVCEALKIALAKGGGTGPGFS